MTQLALKRRQYDRLASLPFFLLHLAVLLALTTSFRPIYLAWLAGSYFLRMFGVTAGYHRYFSHRAFTLNRFWQFVLACLAQSSGQKGVLWWAAHHRDHHRHSDSDADVHSPVREGFWWSHVGWILSDEYFAHNPRRIADFRVFPELRWLNRWHLVPTVAYAAIIFAVGGWGAFVWGFVISTVVLYHGTFLINSLAHIWGTRRFETNDHSRNNFALAIVTMGEGWHNNHHHFMASARQGIRWWEIDVTFYLLTMLSWMGVAKKLKPFRP